MWIFSKHTYRPSEQNTLIDVSVNKTDVDSAFMGSLSSKEFYTGNRNMSTSFNIVINSKNKQQQKRHPTFYPQTGNLINTTNHNKERNPF